MTVENNDIIYKETVVMANQEEIKVPAAEEAQVPEIIQTVEDLQAKMKAMRKILKIQNVAIALLKNLKLLKKG